MASKKEIPNINESMPLMDKNDENNELAELNKPLILTKEYNSPKELIKKYENEIKEFKNLHQGYNEKIKEEITEELYNFLDKKIKKNTLKLIVDQQLEIKKFQKKNNYLNENKKILEARNGNLSSNLLKIAKLEKSLKAGTEEFAKQKLLEDRISLFEKRITDTEKEIETQSLLKNKITKLEKDFVGAKVETRANEVTDTEKLHQIKEIKVENNLKKDLTNVRQETLMINDVIKDQEQQLKLLYEEKIELNQNTLDFQKNKNQLKSEFIHKQQELIKKYEKEMKELKNLNQEYNEKIISLEKANSDLKNKEDEIKHYQNDNLRLANQLFETSKILENTKAQINKFESNKSQIQEQIHNLNEIISKNNIVKGQINQFNQNKDTQNISKITVKEKPDIGLTINHESDAEKNKVLEELNLKTKNIFDK